MTPYADALLVRIAERIDTSGGPDACWPWMGTRSHKRPQLSPQPVVSLGKVNFNPRRVLREIALGYRMETAQRVRDTCGNTICCNHRHLKGGTMVDRLEAQVDKSAGPDACWPWRGYTLKGYGRLRERRGTPWVFAHRLAFSTANGVELVPEQVIMHLCDNPPCCNPCHLKIGTNSENTLDMWQKNRGACGPTHAARMRRARADKAAGIVKVRRPPGRPKKSAQVSRKDGEP